MDLKDKRVFFIDLDGTLINTYSGETFPLGIWDIEVDLDTFDRLSYYFHIHSDEPFYIFIVTNQGGIDNGHTTVKLIKAKLEFVKHCLVDYILGTKENKNLNIQYSFCTTTNKDDQMRKPNIGMFNQCNMLHLPEDLFNNKEMMVMIGDASGLNGHFSDSDKKFAENAGIDYIDVLEFKNADC